uniref:Uncharacterized protein n=1 Tax=Anguilla anguilla TaxID=7936 RepID=A0A0E9RNF0_ANGAN
MYECIHTMDFIHKTSVQANLIINRAHKRFHFLKSFNYSKNEVESMHSSVVETDHPTN